MAKFSRHLVKQIKDKYGVSIKHTTVRDICVDNNLVKWLDGAYAPTLEAVRASLIHVYGYGVGYLLEFEFTDAGVDFVYGQYIDDYTSNSDYLYDDVAGKTEDLKIPKGEFKITDGIDPKKIIITDSKKNLRFHTNIERFLECVEDYPDDIHFVSINNKIYSISKEEENICLTPVEYLAISR